MTVNELKKWLHALVSMYFAGANVVWSQTKMVKPLPALVTLRIGSVNRPLQPIVKVINGVSCGYYPSTATFEVNLYTKGAAVEVDDGMVIPRENTAINDLLDFVNFINSAAVTDLCSLADINIMQYGDVRDVSAVINSTQWDYRAMVEFTVDFTQVAVGAMGISPESGAWKQTASGGGTKDLADTETGYFENVEIEEES